MKIDEFQRLIHKMYGEKDSARGAAWTFAWLVEEVGELGAALRNADALRLTGKPESRKLKTAEDVARNLHEEFADTLAWLVSLASIAGVDLAAVAAARYGTGCPYCRHTPCRCRQDHPDPSASDSTASAGSDSGSADVIEG